MLCEDVVHDDDSERFGPGDLVRATLSTTTSTAADDRGTFDADYLYSGFFGLPSIYPPATALPHSCRQGCFLRHGQVGETALLLVSEFSVLQLQHTF